MPSSVGPVSGVCLGQCHSGQCRLTLVSECVEQFVGAVSEQCRPVSGILDSGPPWPVSSSVGVSECRSVGVSGGCQVGVRWVIVSSSDEMLWIWMSQEC